MDGFSRSNIRAAVESAVAAENSKVLSQVAAGSPDTIGVADQEFDLSDSRLTSGQGLPLALSGQKLIYRREGSNPGGRLLVSFGSVVRGFYPGCVIESPVDSGALLLREANSADKGPVRLTVVKKKLTDFVEPDVDVPIVGPGNLVGTVTGAKPNLTFNYASIAAVAPSGVPGAAAAQITGYKVVRILIDMGGTATGDLTLVPWYSLGSGRWFVQYDQAFVLPDPGVADRRYRVATFQVAGDGYLQFVPSVAVDMIVQGIA